MRRLSPVALLFLAVLLLAPVVPAWAVTYLSAIADLPLPDGLAEQTDKSTVFDAPLGRIITAYATGTVDADEVRDFYDDALPPLGWEKTGEGSFEGMSNDPVATAASNNPVLSTLVSAVTKAELGATLNGAQNITVFAPANSAFEKIPAADLQKVLNDPAMLKKVLTYHVVGERITPDKLGGRSFKTLEGGNVTVAGSGTDFTVNGNAKVVCGNVQTANATVYIIDTVLMPTA